jgi:cell division protease FtsH
VDILAKNGVDISVSEGAEQGNAASLFGNLAFPLLAFGGLFFLFRRAQGGENGGGGFGGMGGGGGGPMDFGKSKSKFQEVPETGVTFADVAGVDGAKLELQEVVDFLKNPDKYTALGAKIPKGCLLVGPPGTGKTLLAKAVAGEAGVPFFSCAASEFVEMFVGVGASRVRDLFEKAKSKAPCIVFIDEIDAVGRQRGAGMGGGNDEREQTINQLLTEMDGFEGNTGVIVLAATNRPDVLDSALLRPGRFDRQVTVDLPDVAGRIRILKVHARGKTIGKDVDYDKVARRTPGFSGAALQNLLNEAAILAARRELTEISKEEIADALERIVAGAAKEGAVMSLQKKRLVAYHEAGHAIVGALMPEYDPVTKISIVPRGNAGGLTFFAPSEERLESGLYSRSYLENQMAVAMGGRIAEELIFGAENVTTGASGDFQQVTRTARMMVEQMGFSEKIGQIALKTGGGQSFLGGDAGRAADYSQATANLVDSEVKLLVEKAYRRAKDLVTENINCLHAVADVLLDKENIDGDEFEKIMLAARAELYLKEDNRDMEVPFMKPTAV